MKADRLRRFAFRLALAVGEWDVDGMLRAMPAALLSEWMAFDELEPFGEQRGDLRSALVAMTVANAQRGPKQKPFTIQDFLLKFEPAERRKQTWQEQHAIMQMIADAMKA